MDKEQSSRRVPLERLYLLGMLISILLSCVTSGGLDGESGSIDALLPMISVFLMMLFALCFMVRANGVSLLLGWIQNNTALHEMLLLPLPLVVLFSSLGYFFDIDAQSGGIQLATKATEVVQAAVKYEDFALDIMMGLLSLVTGVAFSAFVFLVAKMYDMSRYHGAIRALIWFSVAASMAHILADTIPLIFELFKNVMTLDFALPVTAFAVKALLITAFVCFTVEVCLLITDTLKGEGELMSFGSLSEYIGVTMFLVGLLFLMWALLLGDDRAIEHWRFVFMSIAISITLGAVYLAASQTPAVRSPTMVKYAKPGVLILLLVASVASILIANISVTEFIDGDGVAYLFSWSKSISGLMLSQVLLGLYAACFLPLLAAMASISMTYYWGVRKISHDKFMYSVFMAGWIVLLVGSEAYIEKGWVLIVSLCMIGVSYLAVFSKLLEVIEGSFADEKKQDDARYCAGNQEKQEEDGLRMDL